MRTAVLILTLLMAANLKAADRPNIVFILADDMGYGDWEGGNPQSLIKTPELDRLAKEGLTFTDGHSASTVCTPSRYGLLTGINPAREGITNTLLKYGNPLIQDTPTIAGLLKQHGYATRMIGKWHLGWHMDMSGGRAQFDFSKPLTGGPVDCGFDHYFGTDKANAGPPYFYIRDRAPVAKPTGSIGRREGVSERRMEWQPGAIAPGFVHEEVLPKMLEESLQIIQSRKNADKPLFLYLSLPAPHAPWVPAREFQGRSKAGPRGDYVEQIDDLVGKVNAALKEAGIAENTLLVFSSDNGSLRPKEGEENGHLCNGVLRAGKASPYEGGHRVPMIVKWPDVVPASTVTDATVNHTDMFATVIDILGADDKEKYLAGSIDSHSFLPVLKDPEVAFGRPSMFNNNSTCRIGDWKIVVSRNGLVESNAPDKRFVELYNLKNDLGETKDLSSEHPERLETLVRTYTEFRSQWTLRPEAIQLKKDKAQRTRKQKPKRTSGPNQAGKKGRASSKNLESDDQGKPKDGAPVMEIKSRITELRKKIEDVFNDEQKQARAAAKKNALEDGIKGAALRAAVDAAANLTHEQKRQLQELRQATGKLIKDSRASQRDTLTGEQKAQP